MLWGTAAARCGRPTLLRMMCRTPGRFPARYTLHRSRWCTSSKHHKRAPKVAQSAAGHSSSMRWLVLSRPACGSVLFTAPSGKPVRQGGPQDSRQNNRRQRQTGWSCRDEEQLLHIGLVGGRFVGWRGRAAAALAARQESAVERQRNRWKQRRAVRRWQYGRVAQNLGGRGERACSNGVCQSPQLVVGRQGK